MENDPPKYLLYLFSLSLFLFSDFPLLFGSVMPHLIQRLEQREAALGWSPGASAIN